jgi:hypothetical protein
MHGRTPKVSHFHVFGCKCFILKKGKKLDKFETCEVTFDETQPRIQLVFECAGDDVLGEEIFLEEEHEHGDDEDGGVVPPAEH